MRMDIGYYLGIFQKAADRLDKRQIIQKQTEVATGIYLDSVFLKVYKLSWANKTPDPLTASSRIFFSVWINDRAIKENKICYNIHAFKLRHLNGYSIASREFAADFRREFTRFENHWPNVSTEFGPLTLMEGWVKFNETAAQDDIMRLVKKFLKIAYLIDELLEKNRR